MDPGSWNMSESRVADNDDDDDVDAGAMPGMDGCWIPRMNRVSWFWRSLVRDLLSSSSASA
jgi:hypothetical protein